MTDTPKTSRLLTSALRATVPVAIALIIVSSAAANAHAAVLTHPATQQCLDANVHQGVFLNTCNGGSYQDWTARQVSGTTVTLVDGGTGLCLDANIHQGPFLNNCNGDSYQEWDARAVDGTTVSLINVATQRCLDANTHQGVFLNTCNGGSYQDWQVTGSWAYCLVNCSTPAPAPKPPAPKPPAKSTPSSPSSPPAAVPPATSSPPVRRASPLPRRRRAHLSLGGTPRWLHNGEAVLLRGRVSDVQVPGGVVVLLQARVSPHHWITFGWARINAKDSFSLRYQFTRTTGTQTYLMRAVLPTQFGYRSRSSLSNVFRVRVTGPVA